MKTGIILSLVSLLCPVIFSAMSLTGPTQINAGDPAVVQLSTSTSLTTVACFLVMQDADPAAWAMATPYGFGIELIWLEDYPQMYGNILNAGYTGWFIQRWSAPGSVTGPLAEFHLQCTGIGPVNIILKDGIFDWTLASHHIDQLNGCTVSPNGGQSYAAGTIVPIMWGQCSVPDYDPVVLEYSIDNGATWNFIDTADNISGYYEWQAPAFDSDQCLVKVSDSDDPAVSDVSDAPFTIFICQYQSPADMNDDCYVNLVDLSIFALEWLNCGNPFDQNCITQPNP